MSLYNYMTPEQQRQLKIERFGYDPTIPSKYLGADFVTHNEKRSKFDFFLRGGAVEIYYFGCNGRYLSGQCDLENKRLIGLPEEFSTPFFNLLSTSA